jgi:hypothetical protein
LVDPRPGGFTSSKLADQAVQKNNPGGDGLETSRSWTREKAIRPLLAAAQEIRPSRGSQNATALGRHYETVRAGMAGILRELGVAA